MSPAARLVLLVGGWIVIATSCAPRGPIGPRPRSTVETMHAASAPSSERHVIEPVACETEHRRFLLRALTSNRAGPWLLAELTTEGALRVQGELGLQTSLPPALDRCGRQLAFVGDAPLPRREGPRELSVEIIATGERTVLLSRPHLGRPTWAGSSLAVTLLDGLLVVSPDGRSTVLARRWSGGPCVGDPRHPDGHAAVCAQDGGSLVTHSFDGTVEPTAPETIRIHRGFGLSDDGHLVVYSENDTHADPLAVLDGVDVLSVFDRRTQTSRRLGLDDLTVESAIFVGDQIVFTARRLRTPDGALTPRDGEGNPSAAPDLFVVDVDGTNLRSLGTGYFQVTK